MSLNLKAAAVQDDAKAREIVSLRAAVKNLTLERDKLLLQLGVIEGARKAPVEVPTWLTPKPVKGGLHHATLCLLLTDTHFDEVVDPAEVHGLNAYNREIAELRLRRAIERSILLARRYWSGVTYDGVTLFLGGDMFSGNIHEELARTNVGTLFESLRYWRGPMGAALGTLADEFKRVHVIGTPGNHGRMTRKPVAKKRAADNLDWVLYWLLEDQFKTDARVTVDVPQAADSRVTIYGVKYLLTHGDQFRGGSGISAAMAPLMLGSHRKTRREVAAGRPYDVMVMGHWHRDLFLPGSSLIVGNCLKGYDEYAFVSNFEYRPPAQSLWLTIPEYGVGTHSEVYVMDRKAERW